MRRTYLFTIIAIMCTTGFFQQGCSEGSAKTKSTIDRDLSIPPPLLDQKRLHFPLWDGITSLEQYSKLIGVPSTLSVRIDNELSAEFALVPAGLFLMGSPLSESPRFPEELQHWVVITEPFYIGKTEVVQSLYEAVAGKHNTVVRAPQSPVTIPNWNDANTFCSRMSKATGYAVRLPTEAEWEFACRAGTKTAFYPGPSDADLFSVAWTLGTGNNCYSDVARKPSNAFGLYDMHGNVWEWCSDYYAQDYYSCSPLYDPKGPTVGIQRVYRGGAWNVNAWRCRSAYRPPYISSALLDFIGLRVVIELPSNERTAPHGVIVN
jgi:formylglycine-generating enzyme required for sulfatase activity